MIKSTVSRAPIPHPSSRTMLTIEDIDYITKRLNKAPRRSKLAGYFEAVMQDYKPPPDASPSLLDGSCDTFLPITSSNSGTQGSLDSSPRCPLKSDIVVERKHCEYFSSLQTIKTDEQNSSPSEKEFNRLPTTYQGEYYPANH